MSKMCLVYSSTIVEVKAWPKYICFVLLIAPSKEDMLYVNTTMLKMLATNIFLEDFYKVKR